MTSIAHVPILSVESSVPHTSKPPIVQQVPRLHDEGTARPVLLPTTRADGLDCFEGQIYFIRIASQVTSPFQIKLSRV